MSPDIQSLPDTRSPTKQAGFRNCPSGTAVTLNQFDNIAPTPRAALKLPYLCVSAPCQNAKACCKASKQTNTKTKERALLFKIPDFVPAGATGDWGFIQKHKCRVTPSQARLIRSWDLQH